VSRSRRPSLVEIAAVLGHLSDNVARDTGANLDPILSAALLRAATELRRHIPGFVPPPDPAAARWFAATARAALASGEGRRALASAIAGLARAPHDPELHYLAGSACFELGAVKAALAEIGLALWVHPGFESARRDFEALSAYWESERGRARRSPVQSRRRATKNGAPDDTPLSFEFIEEDETRDDAAEGDRAA
jgi:hypothetical protein